MADSKGASREQSYHLRIASPQYSRIINRINASSRSMDQRSGQITKKSTTSPQKVALILSHEIHTVCAKFIRKFDSLPANASYEAVERTLFEFSIKELDLLQKHIMSTKEVSLPYAVRKTIHMVAKKTLQEKNLHRLQKPLAIADTAKYCHMFYQTPPLPPIKSESVVSRTSRTLILKQTDIKTAKDKKHKLRLAGKRAGYLANGFTIYTQSEEANTDPQDLFVMNLENSLPKVAVRNYHLLKGKEREKQKRESGAKSLNSAKSKKQENTMKSFNINLKRDDTFYINCGLNIFRSYNLEVQQRIRAMKNGASYEAHWTYCNAVREEKEAKQKKKVNLFEPMTPKNISPPPVFITTLPTISSNHHNMAPIEESKYSTATATALLQYEEELARHWNEAGEPYMKSHSLQKKFVRKRFELFKDKLKSIYILMCMMKNIKMFHLRQDRLPMQLIWELRADPFTTKTIMKKGRSDLIPSKSNLANSGTITVQNVPSGILNRRLRSPRVEKLKASSVSLSSSSASSASLRHSQQTPPMLETWEDFLAVNPKEQLKPTKRATKRGAYARLARPVSSTIIRRGAVRKQRILPERSGKSLNVYWKLIRKHFITSLPSARTSTDSSKSADGYSSLNTSTLANIIGLDIGALKEKIPAEHLSYPLIRIEPLVAPSNLPKGTSNKYVKDEEDSKLNFATRSKIDWLKTKISLTTRIQKKLRRQYRNTVRLYKSKRNSFVPHENIKDVRSKAATCRKNICSVRFFNPPKSHRAKIEDQQEIWDSMLIAESNMHRMYASVEEMRQADDLLDKLQRFTKSMPLKYTANRTEKMKLLANSVPAYELLTLHMQIAFKFVLGNVLFVDPIVFETWMKERKLTHHPGLLDEPIVSEVKLNEIRADAAIVTKELLKMLSQANMSRQKLKTVVSKGGPKKSAMKAVS